eukprot:3487447-Pyramimonas_sp.AAC.1
MPLADPRQVRTQLLLGGAPAWVRLPKAAWPESWAGMCDPACPVRMALSGHPCAWGHWEKRREPHVIPEGFEPGPSWRCCQCDT